MFFTPRANLPPNEKAQVEYCYRWIADCIGIDRMRLPVLRSDVLLSQQTIRQCVNAIGEHLQHNVDSLKVVVEPQLLEKCGGGG